MKLDEYRKNEGNKYYLKQLNQESGELEWIEINLSSSTEPKIDLENNEQILYPPRHDYYFTHDDDRPKEEPGIQFEWLGEE